jgi:hypothetical protein
MLNWQSIDKLDKLYIIWAFAFQIILILHFAIRKPLFESYTEKYGWLVYALCIPAVIISVILIRGGKSWHYWSGGFLFLLYAIFGIYVDYIAQIQFRNPFLPAVGIPYVILYLVTVMFYWWPLWPLSRLLWGAYTILYILATGLNIRSH